MEYLGLSQYPELLKTGQVVREQLKAVGIDMTIKAVDVSVWYDAFVSGNFQITSAYQERTIDPDNFYSLVLRSGGPINTSGYANPAVDALIDEAAASADDAARMGIYQQMRTLTSTDAPLVFTHFETLNYLMNKNVTGSDHHADAEPAHGKSSASPSNRVQPNLRNPDSQPPTKGWLFAFRPLPPALRVGHRVRPMSGRLPWKVSPSRPPPLSWARWHWHWCRSTPCGLVGAGRLWLG